MRKLSNHPRHRVCLILALIGLMGGLALPGYSWSRHLSDRATIPLATNPSCTSTGNLNTARYFHTATLLPNGKVLVAGGVGNNIYLKSAEIYDPGAGTFTATGNMITARCLHTATLLPNGRVLIAGGYGDGVVRLASAELYDPSTGTFTATGDMITAQVGHDAVLLPNGKVLIAGGPTVYPIAAPAELYDPLTGTFALTGAYAGTGLCDFCPPTVLLPDGRVLFARQYPAQLYAPVSGTFSLTGAMADPDHSTATVLMNGKVLFTGGVSVGRSFTAELYDPAAGTFAFTGNMASRRVWHTATLLPDGTALIAGGETDGPGFIGSLASAELYDPSTGTFTATADMTTPREVHTATLLNDGRVLIAGGEYFGGIGIFFGSLASAELYNPTTGSGTLASVSAARFSLTGLASEAIATSFGAGLATTIAASTLPLPTELAGTTVKVRDSAGTERLAPLFYVSPTQVNYQIPPGTTAGTATVIIRSGDGAVSTGVAQIKAVAPSLFTANDNGQGVAAALALRVKADGSQSYEEVAQFDEAQKKFVARSLDLGPEGDQVYLLLFGSGIRHRSSLSTVIATIGGAYAAVSFAGAQGDFVGLDQVNVRLPRSLSGRGEVEVLLTVDAQMANPVRIQIK